jgi:hypothetical protein
MFPLFAFLLFFNGVAVDKPGMVNTTDMFEVQFIDAWGASNFVITNDKYFVDYGLVMHNVGLAEIGWGSLDYLTLFGVRHRNSSNILSTPTITKEEAEAQLKAMLDADQMFGDVDLTLFVFRNSSTPELTISRSKDHLV